MTTSPRIRPAATPTIGEESLVLFLLVAGAFGLGSDGKAGWTIVSFGCGRLARELGTRSFAFSANARA